MHTPLHPPVTTATKSQMQAPKTETMVRTVMMRMTVMARTTASAAGADLAVTRRQWHSPTQIELEPRPVPLPIVTETRPEMMAPKRRKRKKMSSGGMTRPLMEKMV